MKLLFAFFITMLFLAACTPQQQSEEIKIGAVLSLTGVAAFYGESSRNGIDLAVEEINTAGGINGKKITIVYEDDGTDGKRAVTATTKLIEIDKVDAIIGGTWDYSLEPMAPIADSAKLILINPSTGNTKDNSRLSQYLFRTWPPIVSHVKAYAPVIKQEKIKHAVIFRAPGSWSDSYKENFEQIMKENGGELAADFVGTAFDGNDFATQVTKAKSLKPDAVFLAVGPIDTAHVVKKMKVQQFDAILLNAEGNFGEALTRNAITTDDFAISYYIDMLPYDEEFVKKYTEKYGKEPGISSDAAYTAVKLLAQAYKETGTTDSEAVRQWLQNSSYFDANGDASRPVPIYKIENGKMELFASE